MHPPDQVPGRMPLFQEFLNRDPGLGLFGVESLVDAPPQIGQHIGGDVFGAGHRRNGCRHGVEHGVVRRRHRRLGAALGDPGESAYRRNVARAQFPPIGQHRRQSGADFIGAEPQQPVSGATREGMLQPRAALGVERHGIFGMAQRERAMRREDGGEHHDGGDLNRIPADVDFIWEAAD